MSTRRGHVVFLDDLLSEGKVGWRLQLLSTHTHPLTTCLQARMLAIIRNQQGRPHMDGRDENVAETMALSALVVQDLKSKRAKVNKQFQPWARGSPPLPGSLSRRLFLVIVPIQCRCLLSLSPLVLVLSFFHFRSLLV